MAALSSFKNKLSALKKRPTAIPESTLNFKVDQGWLNLLSSEDSPQFLGGLHHYYEGILLNKTKKSHLRIFACRDIVLSYIMANRVTDKNPSEVIASYLLDLFSDVGATRAHHSEGTPDKVYSAIRIGYLEYSSAIPFEDRNIPKIMTHPVFKEKLRRVSSDEIKELIIKSSRVDTIGNLSEQEIDSLILLRSIELDFLRGRIELEFGICLFLLSIAKTGNISDRQLEKRLLGFQSTLSFRSSLFPKVADNYGNIVWNALANNLKTGRLSLEILMKNLHLLVEEVDNILVTPLVDQVAYRNQTAILLISTAVSGLPHFPWHALATRNNAIKSELQDLSSYLSALEGNKYVGLILAGCSKSFPHLSYLCFQLNLQVLGQTTLNQYRGMGSSAVGIPKSYYDKLIQDFMSDQDSIMGSYNTLKGLTGINSVVRQATSAISTFLTVETTEPQHPTTGLKRPAQDPSDDIGTPRQIPRLDEDDDDLQPTLDKSYFNLELLNDGTIEFSHIIPAEVMVYYQSTAGIDPQGDSIMIHEGTIFSYFKQLLDSNLTAGLSTPDIMYRNVVIPISLQIGQSWIRIPNGSVIPLWESYNRYCDLGTISSVRILIQNLMSLYPAELSQSLSQEPSQFVQHFESCSILVVTCSDHFIKCPSIAPADPEDDMS